MKDKFDFGDMSGEEMVDIFAELYVNAIEQQSINLGKWFCYLCECSDDTLYCGVTNNPTKRIKDHNAGRGAKYTKARRPIKLIKYFIVNSKSDALKLEHQIKKLERKNKLSFKPEIEHMEIKALPKMAR